jgi:hypothetical protein
LLTEVLVLLGWFLSLIVLSFILTRLWMNSLSRWVYLAFAAPGIVVHEISHLIACWLTGARVTEVKLISKNGGSVTHGPPKGGIFGQAIVSMAPLLGMPSALILTGVLFHHVDLFNCDLTWDLDIGGSILDVLTGALSSAWDLLRVNIWDNRSPWFVLYLYLAASFTAALAPSGKDLRNSWIGVLAVSIALVVWALVLDLLIPGWKAPVTSFLLGSLTWIATVGFAFCLIAIIIGLSIYIIKRAWDQGIG